MGDEVNQAWEHAWSIENCPESISDLEEVGQRIGRQQDNRVYILYKDKSGRYWYKVEFLTDRGRISEYEYIFGKKAKRKYKKRMTGDL